MAFQPRGLLDLLEVEKQRFRLSGRCQRELAGFLGAGAVAGGQVNAVEGQRPLRHVQPGASACPKLVRHRLSGLEPEAIDVRVLMNGRRAVPTVGRDEQHFGRLGVCGRGLPFGVAGRQAALAGLNPDLQEMQRLGAGGVEFAVGDAPAGAQQLNLAGLELPPVAQAVLVLQRALQDVAEDFHVPMRMRPKTLPRRHPVVVDDAQGAKADVRRIVIVRKRKGVMRIEPAVVRMTAFFGPPHVQFIHCHFHAGQWTRYSGAANAECLA
jgi:hypothetical protein